MFRTVSPWLLLLYCSTSTFCSLCQTLPRPVRFFALCPLEHWCHGLEVYPGSCSGLPPRSLPSHPRHQGMQFTPIIRTGATLCSFCSYIHNPGPCVLGGWSLCVEWASVVAKIAPQDSFC